MSISGISAPISADIIGLISYRVRPDTMLPIHIRIGRYLITLNNISPCTKEYHRHENVEKFTKKRKVSILKEGKELELQHFSTKKQND